jgi:hypothetical protein
MADGPGFLEQVIQLGGAEAREQRQVRHQRSVNSGHAGQSLSSRHYCTLRASPKHAGKQRIRP